MHVCAMRKRVQCAHTSGHILCAELLLRAGARPSGRCDGNPPLCMAACLALLRGDGRAAAAAQLMGMMLAAGVDPSERCVR